MPSTRGGKHACLAKREDSRTSAVTMTAEFAQVATFQPQTPPVASLASQALPRPLTAVNALHVTQAMWQLLEHQTAVHAQQALHPMQREVSASSATQVSIPGRAPPGAACVSQALLQTPQEAAVRNAWVKAMRIQGMSFAVLVPFHP